MTLLEKLPLECFLKNAKYGLILSYPRFENLEATRRVAELRHLGVHSIELTGEKRVYEVPVLGKGCVGIVVKAYTEAGEVALKVRRVDADRVSMRREAETLCRVNRLGVGPRLYGATENFLVMEFIQGRLLPDWVKTLKGKGRAGRLRRVLSMILEDCFRLDMAGVDHGELSRAPKHIIVEPTDKPRIIDFETASLTRRPANVTSVSQYLLIGSQTAKTIRKALGKIDDAALITALRVYKRGRSRENLQKIIDLYQPKPMQT